MTIMCNYLLLFFSIFVYFILQGMGSFSGHMVTMFVIHLLQSHKISSQMSPYQVFRNAVLNISKLSNGHRPFFYFLPRCCKCAFTSLHLIQMFRKEDCFINIHLILDFPCRSILSSLFISQTTLVFVIMTSLQVAAKKLGWHYTTLPQSKWGGSHKDNYGSS